MASPTRLETTDWLKGSRNGDAPSVDRFVESVYGELRALAAGQLRGGEGGTLTPTVLVHEAYLKLIDQSKVDWKDRAHFLGVASHLIRRALLEHLRRGRAEKRGGGRRRVTLHEPVTPDGSNAIDLLALDDALAALEQRDARKAKVVELRFFGGLTMDEAADVLAVSKKTIEADWYFARAWLTTALATET